MIISASRRTDIPGYYSEWFLNRLKAGYVLTRNPRNHAQVSKILLLPEVIDCVVFWTKDAEKMADKLHIVDDLGYRYYFQFTLTPYGREIEPGLRDKEEIIRTFIGLSEKIGRHRVLWRYDPIILNNKLTAEYHIEKFENLCKRLCGHTNVCTISFVDIYKRLGRTVKNQLLREITEQEMIRLADEFSNIGGRYGIELRACCEKADLSVYGVRRASCIDKTAIETICGCSLDVKADVNQRNGCGCIQSIDIGAYNTCRNGCIYCYANYSCPAVENNCARHNPDADILIGTVSRDEIVTQKKMQSNKNNNYNFWSDISMR